MANVNKRFTESGINRIATATAVMLEKVNNPDIQIAIIQQTLAMLRGDAPQTVTLDRIATDAPIVKGRKRQTGNAMEALLLHENRPMHFQEIAVRLTEAGTDICDAPNLHLKTLSIVVAQNHKRFFIESKMVPGVGRVDYIGLQAWKQQAA